MPWHDHCFIFLTAETIIRKYIVIGKNPPEIRGPFDDLENAKSELNNLAYENGGSRLILEIINGFLQDTYNGVHSINGQDQNPSNGFNQLWNDWNDVMDMINIYKQSSLTGRC